jgi:hypothetical protein
MEAMAHYLNYIENNIIILLLLHNYKENNEFRLVGKEEE